MAARLAYTSPRALRLRRSPSRRRLASSEDRRRRRLARVLWRHRSDRAIAGTRSAHRVDEPARGSTRTASRTGRITRSRPWSPARSRQASACWRAIAGARSARNDCRRCAASTDDLWPADVTPDLTDVDVAIARTIPAPTTQPAVRECETLFLDSIAARQAVDLHREPVLHQRRARRGAGRASARTERPRSHRRLAGRMPRLARAEHDGRVPHQRVPPADRRRHDTSGCGSSIRPRRRTQNVPTFVHSKVMIVDDTLVRIGSANFSRRSMGVDTECDLAVDAERTARVRAGIRRIRDRLLAEHLACTTGGRRARRRTRGIAARSSSIRGSSPSTRSSASNLPPQKRQQPSEAARLVADPEEPIAFGSSVDGAGAAGGRDQRPSPRAVPDAPASSSSRSRSRRSRRP